MAYARQSLASKPERVDRREVLEFLEFRRREPLAYDPEIVTRDSATVVCDVQQLQTAFFYLNVY